MQVFKKIPFDIQLARHVEQAQLRFGADMVQAHAGVTLKPHVLAGHQIFQQQQGIDFADQAGIEGDLVQPVHDLGRGARQRLALHRVDLHDQQIMRSRLFHQREQRRIAGITAVPIRLAVHLDRPKHLRQAGRGHDHVQADFLAPESAGTAGAHAGR